jgi:predicted type IV restriction endonuclease
MHAVLESDPSQMPHRIEIALKAIEERLRKPIEIGSPEHKETEHAQKALAILKAERSEKLV